MLYIFFFNIFAQFFIELEYSIYLTKALNSLPNIVQDEWLYKEMEENKS